MNKIKPFDVIIFISILAFSAFLIKNSFSVKNKNTVTVNADGKIYKYSLEKDGIYTVSGAIGKTTFQIQNKKVKITDSACEGKNCINHKFSTPIVCLPNKIIITIEENGEFDGISQ